MQCNTFQDRKIIKNAEYSGWGIYQFTDLLLDDTRNAAKIKKRDYLEYGLHPIVDQSAELIAGYSNIEEGFYNYDDYIVFGDHTRRLKYLTFPAFVGADGTKVLKNRNQELVKTKYLYYFLKAVKLPDMGYSRHFKFLKEVLIPVPKMEIQKKIVKLLDLIVELREKRQQQIEALLELKQSVFLDMFGDPYININNYPIVDLADCKLDIKNGLYLKKNEYTSNGDTFVVWISDFINTGKVSFKDIKKANVDEGRYADYKISYGDVLFVRSSLTKEGIGKTGYVPRDNTQRIIFEDHIIKISFDDNVLPEYFQAFSETDFFRNEILRKSNTSTMTTINQKSLLSYKLMLPPIKEQTNFLKQLEEIDQRKTKIMTSLRLLKQLYNSLLHKAFNGELFKEKTNA